MKVYSINYNLTLINGLNISLVAKQQHPLSPSYRSDKSGTKYAVYGSTYLIFLCIKKKLKKQNEKK